MQPISPSAHACTTITFEVHPDRLGSYTDEYIAQLWHIAQANPAPFGDQQACALAEQVGHEIIRRFVGSQPPELWHHQGRHARQRPEQLARAATIDQLLEQKVRGDETLTTEELVALLDLGDAPGTQGQLCEALRRNGFARCRLTRGNHRLWVWQPPDDWPHPESQAGHHAMPGMQPQSSAASGQPPRPSAEPSPPAQPTPAAPPAQTALHQSAAPWPFPPGEQTAILWMPAGSGKSAAARHVADLLGCQQIVDEWDPSQIITRGALHLTNMPLEGGAA